ncbi:MAG: pyridoxal phosphate-dependent aminotransferase, partial [Planctomycetota bacterium]
MSPFRDMPFMGVIRVNEAAGELGYVGGDPAWANLGQGQPEVGDLPGAPPRISRVDIDAADHAYGQVEGLGELREAVAAHYNRLYRHGMGSRYTAENVMITPGGRTGLSRCGAALDRVHLGHFSPDYTAYEDMLRTFDQARPCRIVMRPEDAFRVSATDLAKIVRRESLTTLLISNPCNPTGVVMREPELDDWLRLARDHRCTLLLDEFYSHFVYGPGDGAPVSAAAVVEDVDRDPVVIFDGLTKCYRYPGWRVGWIVAPRPLIRTMTA